MGTIENLSIGEMWASAFQSLKANDENLKSLLQQFASASAFQSNELSALIAKGQFSFLSETVARITDTYANTIGGMDHTILIEHYADTIHQSFLRIDGALNSLAQAHLKGVLVDPSDSLRQFALALEVASPYMPESLRTEVQEKAAAPAATKGKFSIDTALALVSLVLTILFFLYDQITSQELKSKEEAQAQMLSQTAQQLVDEIGYLGHTVQLLADEVDQLRDQLDDSDKLCPNTPYAESEDTEKKALEQIDCNQ